MARVLINGCSHSSASDPDSLYPSIKGWPEIFEKITDVEIIDLAERGKSNHWMIEELIRYLINDDSVDHVVVMLTEMHRLNLYRRSESGRWKFGDIKSQLSRLKPPYKRFHWKYLIEHGDKKPFLKYFNDKSFAHQIITTGTMLNALSQICSSKNIGLTIGNFYPIMGLNDIVWNSIPFNNFLCTNIENGLLDVFLDPLSDKNYNRDDPDDPGHLNELANTEIAEIIKNHYLHGDQITIGRPSKLHNYVYNYT